MPSPTASRGIAHAPSSRLRPPARAPLRRLARPLPRSIRRWPGRRSSQRPKLPKLPVRTLVRLLVGAALAVAAVLVGAAPASAHAVLTGSSPAQGAVVSSAPKEVVLTFSEGVSLSDDSIRVLGPKGERADTGGPGERGSGGEVSYGVELRSELPDGTYTVAWQAVSVDSHPISGAFTFSVGAPSETSVSLEPPSAGDGLVGALYHLSRYVAYTGFVLLVGGSIFVLVCWPGGGAGRPVRRVVVAGWITLAVSTVALLLLRHPFTGSGELSDAVDLGGLRDVLETKTGTALLSRLLLLSAAALFMTVLFGAHSRAGRSAKEPSVPATADRDRDRGPDADQGTGGDPDPDPDPDPDRAADQDTDPPGEPSSERPAGTRSPTAATGERPPAERQDLAFGLATGGLMVATGLAATWAMAEHASTGVQPQLAMPLDMLHLLAVAVWLGGLFTLLVALYRGPAVPVTVVQRFSRLAMGSVLVLVATGLYQSWRQVGSWSALVLTDFGQLLLVKVALIAVLLGFGSLSRGWTAELTSPPEENENKDDEDDEDENEDGDEEQPATKSVPAPAATRSELSKPASNEPDPEPEPDPVRATQLARQRQVLAKVRERRERERATDPVRHGLRRSVLAEAGIALAVLAVTTTLTTTEPGRTEESTRPAGEERTNSQPERRPVSLNVPFDTGGAAGTARVQLTPGATGTNALYIRFVGPKGRPLDVAEVKAALIREDSNIGPLSAAVRRVGPGHWTASGVQLPMPGDWQISLTIRTSDVDQVTEVRDVKIS